MFFPNPVGNTAIESALIWAVDGTVCRAEHALYHVFCCLRMQIMRCCHHSVSIARSRLMTEK